jgi:hypothetical protein
LSESIPVDKYSVEVLICRQNDTGNKMVMVASGFGDGYYNSYFGYDLDGQICQIIVPMVNPSVFIE